MAKLTPSRRKVLRNQIRLFNMLLKGAKRASAAALKNAAAYQEELDLLKKELRGGRPPSVKRRTGFYGVTV